MQATKVIDSKKKSVNFNESRQITYLDEKLLKDTYEKQNENLFVHQKNSHHHHRNQSKFVDQFADFVKNENVIIYKQFDSYVNSITAKSNTKSSTNTKNKRKSSTVHQIIKSPELLKQSPTKKTITVIKVEEDEENFTNSDVDKKTTNSLQSAASQILRKFRIPKSIALTTKLNNSTSCATPALITTSTVNSSTNESTKTVQSNSSISIEATAIKSSSTSIQPPSSVIHSSLVTISNPISQPPPLLYTFASKSSDVHSQPLQTRQFQTLQNNGATVTCFNLPPNTIVISPDGTTSSILGATVTTKNGFTGNSNNSNSSDSNSEQPQIISIQDWNGSEVVNLSSANVSSAPQTVIMSANSNSDLTDIQQQSLNSSSGSAIDLSMVSTCSTPEIVEDSNEATPSTADAGSQTVYLTTNENGELSVIQPQPQDLSPSAGTSNVLSVVVPGNPNKTVFMTTNGNRISLMPQHQAQ